MSYFDRAIIVTLKHEGGFVDNNNDPGGATNYGISLRWLQQVGDLDGDGFDDGDFDMDGDVDVDDIRAMSKEDAIDLYYRHFWRPYNYARINDYTIAAKVFDTNVNMGAKQAHKLLQRAIKATGARIADDGYIGPKTIEAVNAANPVAVIPAMRSEQSGFYRALVMRNAALIKKGHQVRDFSEFLTGWLRRAYT